MKINKIYCGNFKEGYIEDKLTDGFNIIYSDDNNKGKTIIIQSMMYSLGNTPIFPKGFNYKDYYHITDFSHDNKNYSVCRNKDNIILKNDKLVEIFDNVSEFKYYFSKNIYELPRIIKSGREKVVDFELFYQLFFVGQDKRDTSKIFNSGYYKKDDFVNLLFSLKGVYGVSVKDEKGLREKLKKLNEDKFDIIQKNKVLKKKNKVVSIASYNNNKDAIDAKLLMLEKLKDEIIDLKNYRNRLQNKKIKNEILIKELKSLNRSLNVGKLVCLECGTDNIGFEIANNNVAFDVSNSDIRNDILESINDKVNSFEDEIIKTDIMIKEIQLTLSELMTDEDVSLENLMYYKNDITSVHELNISIANLDEKINEIKSELSLIKKSSLDLKKNQDKIINKILIEMMNIYKSIDPTGELVFDSLFTKRDENYSGSEGSEFYLSKIYSIAKIFKLDMPIIVDAFRQGELSTPKEKIVIDKFKKLKQQVVFTATLKKEELGKYDDFESVNTIDYSFNKPNKILQPEYAEEIILKIENFGIVKRL